MKTFDQFKEWILDEATKKHACEEGKGKAKQANDWQSLLSVVKEYAGWLYQSRIINATTLVEVPDEELVKVGIYVNKTGIVQSQGYCVYYNSISKHYGSSTSKHYGYSISKHYDSSKSEHYDSSTSEHFGSSYATISELKDKSIINDDAVIRERSTGKLYFKKHIQIEQI